MRRTWGLLVLVVSTLHGAPGVTGPVTGLVLDERLQALRPIYGMPGSSLLGPALPAPTGIAHAAVSRTGDFAITVGAPDGQVSIWRGLLAEQPEATLLATSIGSPDVVVLNAAGSAVALYSESQRMLQIVTGLPNQPAAQLPIDLSAVTGKITSLALEAAGNCALLGAADTEGGAVFMACAGSDGEAPVMLLLRTPQPSAMVFLHGDSDALVADRLRNEVVLIRDVHGSAEVVLAAVERDGISGPVGMQLSPDQKELWVANRASACLTVHDLEGGGPSRQIDLTAAPTKLHGLNSAVFLLNDAGAGPLFVLDTNDRHTYFVPAD